MGEIVREKVKLLRIRVKISALFDEYLRYYGAGWILFNTMMLRRLKHCKFNYIFVIFIL